MPCFPHSKQSRRNRSNRLQFFNERSKHYLGTVEEGLTARGEQVISHTPMGRFGEAADLIGCVKWLLDARASSFVTGITVPVDGGFLTLSGV